MSIETVEIQALSPGDRFRLSPAGEDCVVTARRFKPSFGAEKIETVSLADGKFASLPLDAKVVPMPSEQERCDEHWRRGYEAGQKDEWLFPSGNYTNEVALRTFRAGCIAGSSAEYGVTVQGPDDFEGMDDLYVNVGSWFDAYTMFESARREKS